MFSGPVTTITSMPASESNLRARAVRWSYSDFANADSEPCFTSLAISRFCDRFGSRSVEVDAEAGCIGRLHRAVAVREAASRIVDEAIGAIELGKGGPRGAGNMKRCGGRRGALIHLPDHERHARSG